MNILVVDDEKIICQGVEMILKEEGHCVDMAMSVDEALNKIGKTKYQIAIIDLMMPRINGNELIKRLTKEHKDITVLMMTGYNTIEIALESMKYGAFDFISKPFTEDELIKSVKKSIERAKLTPECIKELPRPRDIYYLNEHSWVKALPSGNAIIGIDVILLKISGKIVKVNLLRKGNEVIQGFPFTEIINEDDNKQPVLSPISGTVYQRNDLLLTDTTTLNIDPYDKGWLLHIIPHDLKNELEKLKKI